MGSATEWTSIAKTYDPLKAGSIDGTDTRPHDRAIERSLQAEYFTNKHVVGNAKSTIFVARLNPKTTQDTLKEAFSKYGKIKRCRLVRDIVTGSSKCYGFLEYDTEKEAFKAYHEANKSYLEGYEIFVDFECERTLEDWVPRRLGGGFGGKKESGQLRFGGRDRPYRKPILLPNDGYSSSSKWNNRPRYGSGFTKSRNNFHNNPRSRNDDGRSYHSFRERSRY